MTEANGLFDHLSCPSAVKGAVEDSVWKESYQRVQEEADCLTDGLVHEEVLGIIQVGLRRFWIHYGVPLAELSGNDIDEISTTDLAVLQALATMAWRLEDWLLDSDAPMIGRAECELLAERLHGILERKPSSLAKRLSACLSASCQRMRRYHESELRGRVTYQDIAKRADPLMILPGIVLTHDGYSVYEGLLRVAGLVQDCFDLRKDEAQGEWTVPRRLFRKHRRTTESESEAFLKTCSQCAELIIGETNSWEPFQEGRPVLAAIGAHFRSEAEWLRNGQSVGFREFPGGLWIHDGRSYELNRILEIAADYPVETVKLKNLRESLSETRVWRGGELECGSCGSLSRSASERRAIHWTRLASVSLNFPIILAADHSRMRIVDGAHRVERAIREGKELLFARVVPLEKLEQARALECANC